MSNPFLDKMDNPAKYLFVPSFAKMVTQEYDNEGGI
jgi:hypothetical protein